MSKLKVQFLIDLYEDLMPIIKRGKRKNFSDFWVSKGGKTTIRKIRKKPGYKLDRIKSKEMGDSLCNFIAEEIKKDIDKEIRHE